MAYETAAQSTAAKALSLMDDTASICNRLSEIKQRLSKIADALHGPQPHDAGTKAELPSPNNIRRNVDTAFSFIGNVEEEIARIEAKL